MPRQKKAAPAPVRPPVTFKTTPELIAELDAIAVEEDRPRGKVIEIACRQFVQNYRHRSAADPLAKHLAPPTVRERAVRA